MPIADLVAALKARWRLETMITLLVVALAIGASLVLPRTYAATARLLIDERAPDPAGGAEQAAGGADLAWVLGTQADIVRSDDVAREVVRREKLLDDPKTIAKWQKATGGTTPAEAWLAQGLVKGLKVTGVENSNVLAVAYSSADPQQAARFANAFTNAYLDTRLKMSTDPVRSYTRWFEAHMREVRDNLTAAQNRLTQFQSAHGILGAESINAEGDRLAQLSQQLAQADAQQADAHARAGADRAASPDVQSSTVMTQLRTQIAQKAADVAHLAATLGPNHPQMVAARGELAALGAQLGGETGTMSRSLAVASGDATDRTGQLRKLVEAQRARMFALQGDRSQLAILQRDVDSANTAYDTTSQRLNAMRIQTELPRANVRLLDGASVPLIPDSPNIPLRAALALIFGGMLGVSVAAALEWMRPRVRTAAGLGQITGAPMIAEIDLGRSRVAHAFGREAA